MRDRLNSGGYIRCEGPRFHLGPVIHLLQRLVTDMPQPDGRHVISSNACLTGICITWANQE